MSLITEQIGMLRDVAKAYSHNGLNKILNEAADTIEELSGKLHASQMERSSQYCHDGWIPCDERMPKISQPVLVTDKQGNVCIRAVASQIRGKKYWSQDKSDIIAWRPLPKPYTPTED